MTTRADYSPEEWNVLGMAALMIAMPVITVAEIDTVQITQEVAAMVQKIGESIEGGSDNELINDLMMQMRERLDSGERLSVKVDISDPVALKMDVLDILTQAATLLDNKTSAEEATGFKQWIMSIAQQVAEAVREGEMLEGTVNISPDEAAVMAEMRDVLKLS
ncbi:MAG: hypothetical protein HC911_05510 [Chloroflexaceae bacterium]|nr:hypothetical protein [Chloroflexaceae bacterium]